MEKREKENKDPIHVAMYIITISPLIVMKAGAETLKPHRAVSH